jgi:hypothetical protein
MFVLGALAASAAAFAAPANAQMIYPDAGYNIGYAAPDGAPAEYAAPELRATPGGATVTTRLVQRNPDRRVIVGAAEPVIAEPVMAAPVMAPGPYAYEPAYYGSAYYGTGYYGPDYEAPLATGTVVSRRVVTGPAYGVNEYANPELRATPGGGMVRTKVISRNPTKRAVVDQYGRVVRYY